MRQINRGRAVERFFKIDEPGLALLVDQKIAWMGVCADKAEAEIRLSTAGECPCPFEVFADGGFAVGVDIGPAQKKTACSSITCRVEDTGFR